MMMKRSIISLAVILLSGCSAMDRADKPAPLQQVNRIAPAPLPASAANALYVFYAGGTQDLELYLRFDCDAADVDSWVDSAVSSNNAVFKRSLPYSSIPIAMAPKDGTRPAPSVAPISWWTPLSIVNGYYRGAMESYGLRFWVDKSRSRVYVYQND